MYIYRIQCLMENCVRSLIKRQLNNQKRVIWMPRASILILQPNKSSTNQMLLHSYEVNELEPLRMDVQMQRDMETILQLAIGIVLQFTPAHMQS